MILRDEAFDARLSGVADFASATDLAASVAVGLARETREEVGLAGDVPMSVPVVGFHRNRARGGKPEFVALAGIGARLRDLPLARPREDQALSGPVALVEDGLEMLHERALRDDEVNKALAASAWQVPCSLGLLPSSRRAEREMAEAPARASAGRFPARLNPSGSPAKLLTRPPPVGTDAPTRSPDP